MAKETSMILITIVEDYIREKKIVLYGKFIAVKNKENYV